MLIPVNPKLSRVLNEGKGIGRRMYKAVAASVPHGPHLQSDAESIIIFFFLFFFFFNLLDADDSVEKESCLV